MTLVAGNKLGPYEILALLGAGGMGEVYRARDTRLERTVAIKVLPSYLSSDPARRQRFEREAKTISSLNHPHICTLHDIGHQDDVDFLVMEYLEGETLGKRLERGALQLDQLLRYGIEIADALDKAHRQGITHRDLKPGNVMLTKSGAKLLDFGLAKLAVALVSSPAIGGGDAAAPALPTASDSLTAEGTILGTFQYMAPEQLEGKQVDARTDIFAFGAVVYEMVTGKRAFEGKSQASVIAAILERNPPAMSTLQPMTPPALDRVMKRCLAKEPDERWQSANDLTDELKWIAEADVAPRFIGADAGLKPGATVAPLQRALILSLGALLLGAAIASLAVWSLKPTPPLPITRTVITLPPGERLAGPIQLAVALSPDGNQLVYVANRGGTRQLYLRAMDSLEARPIPGTEGALNPFFSPDGQWVGFFRRRPAQEGLGERRSGADPR